MGNHAGACPVVLGNHEGACPHVRAMDMMVSDDHKSGNNELDYKLLKTIKYKNQITYKSLKQTLDEYNQQNKNISIHLLGFNNILIENENKQINKKDWDLFILTIDDDIQLKNKYKNSIIFILINPKRKCFSLYDLFYNYHVITQSHVISLQTPSKKGAITLNDTIAQCFTDSIENIRIIKMVRGKLMKTNKPIGDTLSLSKFLLIKKIL